MKLFTAAVRQKWSNLKEIDAMIALGHLDIVKIEGACVVNQDRSLCQRLPSAALAALTRRYGVGEGRPAYFYYDLEISPPPTSCEASAISETEPAGQGWIVLLKPAPKQDW